MLRCNVSDRMRGACLLCRFYSLESAQIVDENPFVVLTFAAEEAFHDKSALKLKKTRPFFLRLLLGALTGDKTDEMSDAMVVEA